MPKLVIQEGAQQSVFELFEDEATIGRGAANAIQVVDSRASKHHAVTSSIAAQVIASEPAFVCSRARSDRMRASTGNAVMLMAVPINSAKLIKLTLGSERRGYR